MKNKENKKIQRRAYLLAGIFILIFLSLAFFININVESGANYYTEDSLLGIIIFHNPFILGLYVLLSLVLIINGLKNQKDDF